VSDLAKRFNEAFEYRDGNLYWKINPNKSRKHIGKLAGYKTNSTSYGVVMLDKKSYCLHRVIYCMFHGDMPVVVDHINGNYQDHRIENLRGADHTTNNYNKAFQSNNTSGVKGLTWNKRVNMWQGSISYKRKVRSLGYFKNKEDGAEFVGLARDLCHGEFANHGVHI
tara:strand:+ start:89 stop:589 length:501 start_codon:yes stop_codon:yes gene_type:complete